MVNEDVLKIIANVLDVCIDELDESATDEERVLTLDGALKSMVAVRHLKFRRKSHQRPDI